MDFMSLIQALIMIGILCILAGVIPVPAPASRFVWAIVSIVCLLILWAALTGSLPTLGSRHG